MHAECSSQVGRGVTEGDNTAALFQGACSYPGLSAPDVGWLLLLPRAFECMVESKCWDPGAFQPVRMALVATSMQHVKALLAAETAAKWQNGCKHLYCS
jgi:hypothetical protein